MEMGLDRIPVFFYFFFSSGIRPHFFTLHHIVSLKCIFRPWMPRKRQRERCARDGENKGKELRIGRVREWISDHPVQSAIRRSRSGGGDMSWGRKKFFASLPG